MCRYGYGAGFAYYQLPARIDDVRTCVHDLTVSNALSKYTIRFDGRTPINYSALEERYPSFEGLVNGFIGRHYNRTGWRGEVAESRRYDVARLLLLMGNLARMRYERNNSASAFRTLDGNSTLWYGRMQLQNFDEDYALARAAVLADLKANRPVIVEVPGHAVFAHGFAVVNGVDYLYLNYGWCGESDGWYALSDRSSDNRIKECHTGFIPRKTVQLDPLPRVVKDEVQLNWHLPKCYENDVVGFDITKIENNFTKDVFTFTDNFEDNVIKGELTNNGEIDIYPSINNQTKVLHLDGYTANTYLYPQEFTLTGLSDFSFRIRSENTIDTRVEVQALIDAEEWITLFTPEMAQENGSSILTVDWKTYNTFLGEHAGKTIQLRFAIIRTGGTRNTTFNAMWEEVPLPAHIYIDDVALSNVTLSEKISSTTQINDPSARTFLAENLKQSTSYEFTVTPRFNDALGEESACARTHTPGVVTRAQKGVMSEQLSEIIYSVNDTKTWSVKGTQASLTESEINLFYNKASLTCDLDGKLGDSATFSYDRTLTGYWSFNGKATIKTFFKPKSGSATLLSEETFNSNITDPEDVSISLAQFAGETGEVIIEFEHTSDYGSTANQGLTITNAKVSNVFLLSKPTFIEWEEERLDIAIEPQILSVRGGGASEIQENFYRENSLASNVIYVSTSPSVTRLTARASHITALPDAAIRVENIGVGEFAVSFDASNIIDRQRLILTLAAYNSNGTAAYKDLSLQFLKEKTSEELVIPEQVIVENAIGSAQVKIPLSYFVSNNLAPSNATRQMCEEIALTDSDNDGLPNWAEYVLGTDPTDKESALSISIKLENDLPIIEYSPVFSYEPNFKISLLGTDDFISGSWQIRDQENHPDHRFFKVVIEKIN